MSQVQKRRSRDPRVSHRSRCTDSLYSWRTKLQRVSDWADNWTGPTCLCVVRPIHLHCIQHALLTHTGDTHITCYRTWGRIGMSFCTGNMLELQSPSSPLEGAVHLPLNSRRSADNFRKHTWLENFGPSLFFFTQYLYLLFQMLVDAVPIDILWPLTREHPTGQRVKPALVRLNKKRRDQGCSIKQAKGKSRLKWRSLANVSQCCTIRSSCGSSLT